MKNELMARAISHLEDDLLVRAQAFRPRRRALPRILAAAACLALVLTAALTMTRRAPETSILIGGTALADVPVPIEQPAPFTLDARNTQPLSVSLTVGSVEDGTMRVSVSDGVLDSPLDSFPRALSSRSVSGGETLTWVVAAPDSSAVYTLSLDGRAAAVLRYDDAHACWFAERSPA